LLRACFIASSAMIAPMSTRTDPPPISYSTPTANSRGCLAMYLAARVRAVAFVACVRAIA
jgi:hypothetical protein